MTLLIPLGLLGLLSIAALIIIYIIRPNYQQKRISSTYIWKLSLKYKKRSIPVSKLRNILLIICQVLILCAISLILANPAQVLRAQVSQREVIAVVDASASMRTVMKTTDGEMTFYERAVNRASKLTDAVMEQNGIVTVILAEDTASNLFERQNKTGKQECLNQLADLIDREEGADIKCGYSLSDIDGAMELCSHLLEINPNAEVYLYTDADYYQTPQDVKVFDVRTDGLTAEGSSSPDGLRADLQLEEPLWNAAILSAEASMEDNYYTLKVNVANYSKREGENGALTPRTLLVTVDVYGADKTVDNPNGRNINVSYELNCGQQYTDYTVIFKPRNENEEKDYFDSETQFYCDLIRGTAGKNEWFFSYESITVSIQEISGVADSCVTDNTFELYGGTRPILKVLYASNNANPFFNNILMVLQNYYSPIWDMRITEDKSGNPALEGYDFYLFEHAMPTQMPTDGVVFLSDPKTDLPDGSFRVDGTVSTDDGNDSPTQAIYHTILENVSADRVTIDRYQQLTLNDTAFEVLWDYNGDPIFAVKDEGAAKVFVSAFSLHYSNLALLIDFPILMQNVFDYCFPDMVKGNSFEVGTQVSFTSMGGQIALSGNGVAQDFNVFPAKFTFLKPGAYMLTQTVTYGERERDLVETIYVYIPQEESNIWQTKERLINPYAQRENIAFYKDLLLWFAIALVALTFAEWLLHLKDNG